MNFNYFLVRVRRDLVLDDVGSVLVRGVLAVLLQGLCLGLPRCVRPRLVLNWFHIGDWRLLLVSHRPVSLVDIFVIIKESVVYVKGESANRLVWGYLLGASWSRIRKRVPIGLP